MNNDWEAHKLLIMQELKDLKDGQKEIRNELTQIGEKVTILRVKYMTAAAIVSTVVSIVVAVAIAFIK